MSSSSGVPFPMQYTQLALPTAPLLSKGCVRAAPLDDASPGLDDKICGLVPEWLGHGHHLKKKHAVCVMSAAGLNSAL